MDIMSSFYTAGKLPN